MKQKLNLAILNKRHGEVTKKEMSAVRAGTSVCDTPCDTECGSDPFLSAAMFEALIVDTNCPCYNFWVISGLARG
jgi:hypothetical protein